MADAPPFPLVSDRLRLRCFCEADIATFTAYRADPEVARHQSWENFTADDGARFWASQRNQAFGKLDSWYQVALADREGDELVGDLALHFLPDPRLLELGFTLARAHQGRGLAREAISRMLDWLMSAGAIHRVHCITDAANLPAQRCLLGLGFRREAHNIENVFFKGAWGDEMTFALLAREWNETGQSQP